ncbi:MAG: hypothetical protein AB8F94_05305, partial [Saprospiraceae bacterium]
MKKRKILGFALFLFASFYFNQVQAQVGIGTDNPTNTLHVKPLDPNEDPIKFEDMNQIMQGDSAFVVVDPASGVIRYMLMDDFLDYVTINNDSSNTNELQNASEVPLSPNFDVDNNGFIEENVQEAIEAFSNKLPKGTFKSISEARAS